MHRQGIMTFTTLALLALAILAVNPPTNLNAAKTIVKLRWTNPMQVYDVAVSSDGSHLSAVNQTGLYYFDCDSETPAWWFEPPTIFLRSVATSSDGDCVVAGDNDGFLHYFNQSAQRTGIQTEPTWTSYDMGGPVERGPVDMSANGNYTVVGGTGVNVWFYAGCLSRTGNNSAATWTSGPGVLVDFLTVHISPNGRYVAGGGTWSGSVGFVTFFENAHNATGYYLPAWVSYAQAPTPIIDLALSDDGYAVAAIDMGFASLYYWADSTALEGAPNATWTVPGSFSCLDMNGDGSKIAAGGYYLTSLHFWDNCRTRNGTQSEDWIRLETTNVYDVAMSRDGSIIAAPSMELPSSYKAYFLTQDGAILEGYSLPQFANMVSMSWDGRKIAMAGPGYDSLYLFEIEDDSTPPEINEVWQEPNSTSVYPYNNVNVFANITDSQSGVHQATLNCTNGNGTWFTRPMSLYQQDIWNGTIPSFPYGTTVTYMITAEDNAYNAITSQDLGYTLLYTVIPENLASLMILLVVTTTLMLVAISKKSRKLQA